MRPSYKRALTWIATQEDEAAIDAADAWDIEVLRGYITVALVADLFRKPQDVVALDVCKLREKWRREGIEYCQE